MLVTMLFTYITGILSLQKSFFGFILFAVFLFLPVNMINSVVGTSNRISANLYGDKFTYWALIQQETYSSKIQEAANGDSYGNYLRTLYSENNKVYSNQGLESIKLKWQAPKKMASLMLSSSDAEAVSGLQDGARKLLTSFMDTSYTGESYLDGDNVYLYRSYLDISNFSQYIFKGLKEGTQQVEHNLTNDLTANWNEGIKSHVRSLNETFEQDRALGYTNPMVNGGTNVSNTLYITTPLSSGLVNNALAQRGTLRGLSIDDYVGLNQGFFQFTIPMFSRGGDFQEALKDNGLDNNEDLYSTREFTSATPRDFSGLAAYSLYSENVFYYYSWLLYDSGLSTSADNKTGYKNLLLGDDGAGFFYNQKGNGELKDFMDMKSLFTYIIPYLRQCNNIVREWDDTYGIFTYEGVPTEEGYLDDPSIQDDPELKQKYWHNLNVARLYGIYCPWVDLMYDCSYTRAEKIRVQGEQYVIEDPLDPASYPDSRPMVFSKSEALDYGLADADLTKVEKLIIKCEEEMQERLFELLNYHNFNDVTLNTAAAMNCAFVFNSVFSENGIFTNNINIYPQSFELGDFSYDAFLRFILSNTTKESMTSNNDFYATVVEKSSTVTAVMLILLDVMSIYMLPAFKIFFIIAVFLLSILIIVVTAFRVDSEQKFIKKVIAGLVKPMLCFLAITVSFSYIISLFMGTGNTAVTQSKELSISMGDPVTVMIAMCAVNIGALILYWRVIQNVVKMIVREGKLAGQFAIGVAGAVGAKITGAFSKIKSSVSGGGVSSGTSSGGSSGGSTSSNVASGTGATNQRAQNRASSNTAEGKDDRRDSTRKNDVKRRTVKDSANANNDSNTDQKKQKIEDTTSRGLDNMRKSNNRVKETSVNGQKGSYK